MIVLLCRRTLTGWERVWQEPEKFSEGMYKVQSLGRNNPIYQDLQKKSFAEKALRVLVDTRFTKSQKWALTTKKTNSLPGWTRCCIASEGEDPSLLLSPGETHLVCWVQFWTYQYRRDLDILGWVERKTTKVIRALKHLTHEESWDCSSPSLEILRTQPGTAQSNLLELSLLWAVEVN